MVHVIGMARNSIQSKVAADVLLAVRATSLLSLTANGEGQENTAATLNKERLASVTMLALWKAHTPFGPVSSVPPPAPPVHGRPPPRSTRPRAVGAGTHKNAV